MINNKGNGWEVPPSAPESYGITAYEDIKWFNNMSSPHPLKSFEQKIYFNQQNFEKLHKIYIKPSQDLALNSMAIRAKSTGIECYEIDTGHFPMITSPDALVDLLLT